MAVAAAHGSDDSALALMRRLQGGVCRALTIVQSDGIASRGVASLLHVLTCLQVAYTCCSRYVPCQGGVCSMTGPVVSISPLALLVVTCCQWRFSGASVPLSRSKVCRRAYDIMTRTDAAGVSRGGAAVHYLFVSASVACSWRLCLYQPPRCWIDASP
jgi:hypothetical protein